MGIAGLMRVAGALRKRLYHRSNFLIFAAPAATDIACRAAAPCPAVLLRIAGHAPDAGRALAEEAMQAAGEPAGLVTPRLAHGDEFFGWLADSRVVSFGWVSHRDRAIGGSRLMDAAGRVFLYNFHTIVALRRHGLYTALLFAIRHVLGNEGANEFIIDAEEHNEASLSAIRNAGFGMVAQAGFGLLLCHWHWPHWRSVVADMHQDLFSE
jgi:hypothetical protein